MHRARTPMITIMGLALLSTLALMPRHMGHAAPLAPTVSGDTRWPLHEIQGRLADLQLAYHRRDASTYRTNVQALLGEARRADAAQITARLEVLIDIGRISGYDGFEPLILAYVDLLAKHVNGTGNSPPIATLSELQRTLRFTAPVAANIRMPFGLLDRQEIRAMRGEALRLLVGLLPGMPVQELFGLTLDQLLGNAAVQEDLCNLDPRPTPYGQPAEQEDSRKSLCLVQGAQGGRRSSHEILDDFSDLSCFAEDSTTPAIGELSALTQACIEDSLRGEGNRWAEGGDAEYKDRDGDGIVGDPTKHREGLYPLQRREREEQARRELNVQEHKQVGSTGCRVGRGRGRHSGSRWPS
jgi:hypothetical protein